MSRFFRFAIILTVCLGSVLAAPAYAQVPVSQCVDGGPDGGPFYRICMPNLVRWNGDLVVYAHGYVAPGPVTGIPEDQMRLPDGTYLPDLVTSQGYAFATTSYSDNGLVIRQGIKDILNLVALFEDPAQNPLYSATPRNIYLVGVSEGGLITTLTLEQHPDIFNGGMEVCGPIGNFSRQINYFGDFRVLFDYFFPGILPPSPVEIPPELMENWVSSYTPAIQAAITQYPLKTLQLLTTSRAAIDPGDKASILQTTLGVLWYNVYATNDAADKLSGQPFDNATRYYRGSLNDVRLNRLVQRFSADPAALAEIQGYYQTSGLLNVPLVSMHTVADPIVPYWHTTLYRAKTLLNHTALKYLNVPIFRYGHCAFQANEVLAGFSLLVSRVSGAPIYNIQPAVPDTQHSLYLPLLQVDGAP
jgi:pimeloyl-ACP methyl ester carboxylesterase